MSVSNVQFARTARSPRAQAGAILLVLLSCVTIGVAPVLASLALDGGSNALSIVTARNLIMAISLAMVLLALRRPFKIPGGALRRSLAMGPVYILLGVGYLGAVAYIPVNLTILIYFLHPLLIGIFVRLTGHESVSFPGIMALCLATIGLGIAIGAQWMHLNPVGLGLALMSAIACTIMIVGNSITMKSAESLAVTFWMVLSAAILLAVFQIIFGKMLWPANADGWIGFLGVGLAYTIGITVFFMAIPILGATRATMLTNIEPLLGIGFAMILLNERITWLQASGTVLVLVSIGIMEILPKKPKII
jgi:drug/metabolite transporter (DMT)-like permease